MTILIMLGVSGCMDRHEKNNEEMLAHMKEKYGVEFEIQDYIPRNVDCSYDVWFCNAVGDDPVTDRIEVHRYYGELAKKHEYEDEYYSRLVRDELERRTEEALLRITDNVKCYYSNYFFVEEEFNRFEQLNEYLQTEEGKKQLGMIIYVIDHESEGIKNQDVIDKLYQVIPDAGVGDLFMRIVLVKNKELFDKINRINHVDMLYRDDIYTCNYSGRVSRDLKNSKKSK